MGGGSSTPKSEEEFVALFAANQRKLHAYILAMVIDANAAADILQETNIVLWQKFDQFETGTNFFAWGREIARLTILKYRKMTSRRIVPVDPLRLEELASRFSQEVDTNQYEKHEALESCLKKLRPNDRKLILNRYASGLPVFTIAEKLDRTASSVAQSLYRIRRALIECTKKQLTQVSRR